MSVPAAITAFYSQALTASAGGDPTGVLDRVLASDFKSINSQEAKDKTTLTKQMVGLWSLMPDLAFTPQQVIVTGDTVVVRSIATGTPRGPFMGALRDGSRSFRIDTIDIHTLRGDQIAEVFHLEDWATAIRQLAA